MNWRGSDYLRISDDAQQAADACAAYILEFLSGCLKNKDRATIAISGGSTPKLMFSSMAKTKFDWARVHFFWVDERCVPPTDDQSNFKLADQTLLTPAHIQGDNVHRIYGELPPEEGAARYVEEIKRFFALKQGEFPVFDIIHRGIGDDAHTASLFPGSALIDDSHGIAKSVWVEKMHNHRVTLLPSVLIAGRQTVILAAGDDKAGPIYNVLEGPEDPMKYPCQIAVRNATNVLWFVDKSAAAKMRD